MKKGKKKRKQKKHILFRTFVGIQIFLMMLVLGAVAFYYLSGYGSKIAAMQQEAREMVKYSSPGTFRSVETSMVYDDNGDLITVVKGEKDVYYLEYEKIPAYVTAAIISIEDKKFYSHHGFDIKGILRAAKAFLENGEVTQGGSTITQQLARNIFLSQERTWERKVEEIFIAVELEKKYSKEDILEFYLNNIYFGNGYYGIQAASKGYFSKEITELSLSEIAFLCAIPNNPTLYDPLENMNKTLERRDRILNQMYGDGKISESTCKEAMNEGIALNRSQRMKSDYVETYTYYCAARALMELQGFRFQTEFDSEKKRKAYQEKYEAMFSECQSSLYQKGYRIYTSINMEYQEKLQNVIDTALAEYTETNEEGVYTLQSAAVCLDNHNGMVKAIVGGRNQNMSGYTLNRGYQSFRQPGSAIKPLIVYTPALERGYTQDSVVMDEAVEDGPRNADGVYEGPMTLRRAVEKSKNTVAWNLFEELTPETGLSYLKRMNFSRLKPQDVRLTTALGGFTTGTSPLEMAAGYAALENDGNYRTPTCILKITDAKGELIYEASQEPIAVYEENASRIMTDMLQGVLVQGTGRGLALSTTASAGKTGTTNDNKDGWFVGYTRYYTTSVWVGYDMPKELPGLSGSSYPGVIWYRYMEDIHQGRKNLAFLPPVKVEEPVAPEPEESAVQEPEDPAASEPEESAAQEPEEPVASEPEESAAPMPEMEGE